MRREALAGLWAGTVACSAAPPDNPFGGTDSASAGSTTAMSATATSEATTSGSATSSAGSSTTEDEDEPIFDVGKEIDVPGSDCSPMDENCHCNAVDLIFVIDNSGSMGQYRDQINAAFPLFVGEMFSALPPGTDLHVGLTRATGFYDPGNSGGWGGPGCEAAITDGAWYPPDMGDNMTNGQQGRLYEHDGMRYFAVNTDEDPMPLEMWFQGALAGAITGDDHSNTETVVAGAAYPFHDANAMYNTGFMRQNAVLVLFLVSDSPDLAPPTIPTSDFVDIVRDAKTVCGGDQCIITSGAIQGVCYDQPGNTNTRLYDFMNGFGKPPASWVSLEGAVVDFEGVLGTALADAVATTCDQILPEG
jgi:hypothetical protein